MRRVYLAVDYGSEGWNLTEFGSPKEAINAVLEGETYGSKWKVLEEVEFKIEAIEEEGGG